MPTAPNLSHLFAGLWNKIKRDSAVPTVCISEDDIVVFVVGPTGSGKSWFTKEATKSDFVKASRNLHPFTGEFQAIQCELTDDARKDLRNGVKSVIFVDTPSFLTGCDHPDAPKEFEKWLSRMRYKPRTEYVGVIYMHRVETDPALEPIRDHLQEFLATLLIGDGRMPKRLHVVVSYDKTSGSISPSKIRERRDKLGSQVDQLKTAGRKSSMHGELFQGDPEVAWRAIEELFRS